MTYQDDSCPPTVPSVQYRDTEPCAPPAECADVWMPAYGGIPPFAPVACDDFGQWVWSNVERVEDDES